MFKALYFEHRLNSQGNGSTTIIRWVLGVSNKILGLGQAQHRVRAIIHS